MTSQPLPGLHCVTDGFGEQLLLTLLLHTSMLSTPWLVKKKWQVRKRKGTTLQTGKHKNARAFIMSAGFGNHGNLQTALEGKATWFLLASAACSSYKCRIISNVVMGAVSLALQHIYRIIPKKKSLPLLFFFFKVPIRLTEEYCT